MSDPRRIELSRADAVSHDPGVADRETVVGDTRWALVEYSAGSGRSEWCESPHVGFVVTGTLTYSFEDGREPLVLGPGDAFELPSAPRHRGANQHDEPARLFVIDALPCPSDATA
jgi:quercetin dioxygenase-like cupin family protein